MLSFNGTFSVHPWNDMHVGDGDIIPHPPPHPHPHPHHPLLSPPRLSQAGHEAWSNVEINLNRSGSWDTLVVQGLAVDHSVYPNVTHNASLDGSGWTLGQSLAPDNTTWAPLNLSSPATYAYVCSPLRCLALSCVFLPCQHCCSPLRHFHCTNQLLYPGASPRLPHVTPLCCICLQVHGQCPVHNPAVRHRVDVATAQPA